MDQSSYGVFITGFVVSALAGLAALLRSSEEMTKLKVCSAVLNSGLMGLGISLLWYNKFQENIPFLIGICVLAGLGGMTTLDFVVAAIRKGGFSVKIGPDGPDGKIPPEPDVENNNEPPK